MKKKLDRRVSFLLTQEEFRQFAIKAVTLGQKYTSRIRDLIKKDLDAEK